MQTRTVLDTYPASVPVSLISALLSLTLSKPTALLRHRRGRMLRRLGGTARPRRGGTPYKLTSQPTPNDLGVNSRGSLRFHQRARTRARVGRRQS